MHTALPLKRVPPAAAGQPGVRAFASRMIRQSKARPTDRILIVGGGRGGLVPELCRRGFLEVCHETGDRLPAHELFDVVWLLRLDSEPVLTRVLTALRRSLRPGGTVVACMAQPSSPDADIPHARGIRQRFAACGLVPLAQAPDGGTGCLLTARRPSGDAARWPATA